ncbi:MAG: hypothetical protein ACJ77K_04325 [Bacteroidia bacterium]
MAKDILKRLLFTFLISFAVSMAFAWISYQATEGFEARQAQLILLILCIIINLLNVVLSLTALLNLNASVRESMLTSFLSFLGLPVLLLILIAKAFLGAEGHEDQHFFPVGAPSVVFCIVWAYHYFRWKKIWSGIGKENVE